MNPYGLLGFTGGDPHVIHNAGSMIVDGMIFSLAIGQRLLGTRIPSPACVTPTAYCAAEGFVTWKGAAPGLPPFRSGPAPSPSPVTRSP